MKCRILIAVAAGLLYAASHTQAQTPSATRPIDAATKAKNGLALLEIAKERTFQQRLSVDAQGAPRMGPVQVEDIPGAAHLIDAGADLNSTDDHGITPLMAAINNQNFMLAKLLIEKGADVNAALNSACGDSAGATAIFAAASRGKEDLVSLLIQRGAKLNVATKGGYTALHLAVIKNQRAVVALLIKSNADIGAKDGDGKTALQVAHEHNYTDIEALLRNPTTQPANHPALPPTQR